MKINKHYRGKSASLAADGSLSSTLDNEDKLRQRYSIVSHPRLPILACSDGYLLCVLRLQSAYATQSRLVRELMHETIGLLNSLAKKNNAKLENPFIDVRRRQHDKSENSSHSSRRLKWRSRRRHASQESSPSMPPDWGLLSTIATVEKSSDSGVDSNDHFGSNAVQKQQQQRDRGLGDPKVAEGKIIFSYLPQVLPISLETLDSHTASARMERACEHLQSSWSLLISTSSLEASKRAHECDQTARAVQQSFAHFVRLFMSVDASELREFHVYKREYATFVRGKARIHQQKNTNINNKNSSKFKNENDKNDNGGDSDNEQQPSEIHHEEFKLRVLVEIYMRMLRHMRFDPCSGSGDSNTSMLMYACRFVENFAQVMLKDETLFCTFPRLALLQLFYALLSNSERLLSFMYSLKQTDSFRIELDDLLSRRQEILNVFGEHKSNSTLVDLLTSTSKPKSVGFVALMLEKCWHNLLHYCGKQRRRLDELGSMRRKHAHQLDMLIVLVERHIQTTYPQLTQRHINLHKPNKADLIWLGMGMGGQTSGDDACGQWLAQLNKLLKQTTNASNNSSNNKNINNGERQTRLAFASVSLAHKILYACLADYDVRRFLRLFNQYFEAAFNSSTSTIYTPFDLTHNTFERMRPPRPMLKTHVAIVSVLRSLARFMAAYLMNRTPLFVYSISRPTPMPSILKWSSEQLSETEEEKNYSKSSDCVRIELCRQKLTTYLSKAGLMDSFFCVDKVVELFMVSGLSDEAVYFCEKINDTKSAFFISAMLTAESCGGSGSLVEQSSARLVASVERSLSVKLCSLLGINGQELREGLDGDVGKLLEKNRLEKAASIVGELLLCAVITRMNLVEPLLKRMLDSFVTNVTQLKALVHDEFYLPAPPVYCTQMQLEKSNAQLSIESRVRLKLCFLAQCIRVLLVSSNLHTPLVKWYLEQLQYTRTQMRQQLGVENRFKLSSSLSGLLSSLRYQKLGFIPESLMFMFRDFCALLFYMDLRDKFSLTLRQYTLVMIKAQSGTEQQLQGKI
jgi:hypothetical protein